MPSRSLEQFAHELQSHISHQIIGQRGLVDIYLMSLLAGGHLLLVGPPGVAKTRSANVFSQALGLTFKRIQFTADLLPSDILGAEIYDPQTKSFVLKK